MVSLTIVGIMGESESIIGTFLDSYGIEYVADMTKTRTGPEKRTGKRTEFGIAPRLQSVSAYVISLPDVHGERILGT